jgi:hypothetical protein
MVGVSDVVAPVRRQRQRWLVVAAVVVGVAAIALAVRWWAGPREHVPLPGPDATPEQVVTAYVDAVQARDFDTADAIDARPGSDLGRFSRPLMIENLAQLDAWLRGSTAYVTFTADFDNDGESFSDGQIWGFYLDRGTDGRWQITGAGVG